MTTDIQPELLPVIQADRDFAAFWCVIAPKNAKLIRNGEWDHHHGVQAAARHRLTSTTPILGDMVPADLRALSERATPGPWAWEQCGDKEDAPVVGTIYDLEHRPVAGKFQQPIDADEFDYSRDSIFRDVQSSDGCSASSNAAFAVAAVNFVRSMLSAAPASPIPTSVANEGAREVRLLSFVLQCAAGNPAAIGSQRKATELLEKLGIEGRDGYFFHTEEADLADARSRLLTAAEVNEATRHGFGDRVADYAHAIDEVTTEDERERLFAAPHGLKCNPMLDEIPLVMGEVISILRGPSTALSPALDNTAVEGQEAISDAVHSALWGADAENKRLREALQPFANAADRLTHYGDIDDRYEGTNHRLFASRTGSHLLELLDGVDGDPLTIGHLTEARAALTVQTEKAR